MINESRLGKSFQEEKVQTQEYGYPSCFFHDFRHTFIDPVSV